MTTEILEILIGKYIDGEITNAEQYVLDAELKSNPKARELLEQLQNLHESTCPVVSSKILEPGKTTEEIFNQAWQQAEYTSKRIIKPAVKLRFAAGVAVGLIIGLILHFTSAIQPQQQSSSQQHEPIAQEINTQPNSEITSPQLLPYNSNANVIRNVDWYSFTDEDGDQWLIEGLNENIIKPAVYNEGL